MDQHQRLSNAWSELHLLDNARSLSDIIARMQQSRTAGNSGIGWHDNIRTMMWHGVRKDGHQLTYRFRETGISLIPLW